MMMQQRLEPNGSLATSVGVLVQGKMDALLSPCKRVRIVRMVVLHEVETGLALQPHWGPMYGAEAVSEQAVPVHTMSLGADEAPLPALA